MKQPRENKQDNLVTTAVNEELFTDLWARFQEESGFTEESVAQEKQKVLEEIAMLEARIEEHRAQIVAIEQRETAAKDQMRALIATKLSPETILTAMRVEYKVKRAPAPRAPKAPSAEALPTDVTEEDQEFVMSHLDAEGLTITELKQRTDKDANYLTGVLKVLLANGKIHKTGERRGSKYHLIA